MTKEAIQEIAKMQEKIDVYEMSLTLLAGMCKNKKNVPILSFDLPASPWIEVIYEFIRDHIDESVSVNQEDGDGILENFKKWKKYQEEKNNK